MAESDRRSNLNFACSVSLKDGELQKVGKIGDRKRLTFCSHVSHKHEHLLRAIFQDPVSGNVHWEEIESLLHHLGATIEPLRGARFRVLLNRAEGVLHHPHQGNVCTKQDIKRLREYLAHAGVSPSAYENRAPKERF